MTILWDLPVLSRSENRTAFKLKKMEGTYTTEHCIWLINAVAHLASEATLDSLFGRTFTLNEQIVYEHLDECFEPKVIKHFIAVLNELGKVRNPEEF